MSNLSNAKITRFREDKRLAVISAIRSLSLVGLLITMVFCIFTYREDLNITNIKRIISYIDHVTFEGSQTDTFPFDAGLNTSYKAFDVGIATCSGGSFRFIPPFENMDYSKQIKYSNPYMRVSGNSILVYDLGGTGISRLSSYSLLYETTLKSNILSLSANLSGECSVITDEAGFRTALTVFDKRLKDVYKWQTSDHFAFLSALSPNAKTAAVLCIGQKDGASDTYIRYQPTDGEECKITIDLGNRDVYSMEYYSNRLLMVLCEDGIYAYDNDGALKASAAFTSGSLVAFNHGAESLCAISLKGTKGDSSDVKVFDGECKEIYSGTFDGDIRSIALSGSTLAFISGKELYKVDLASQAAENVELSGVRDVLITETGSVAAVYSDSAKIVSFEKGE
ncbi:MAG: DUF5711 family protein [Clostridiaceae bacterium]|nr:DUF5711 family protein [Clostridiaceae bacterium]